MLNLTIPPQANSTPSDSTLSTNADKSTKNSPENEQFNKILAKETDKSTNAANTTNNKAAPSEKPPTEQSNAKAVPQTPENSAKLAQHHAPKKLVSFELELDSTTPTLNSEEHPASETIPSFAPIISMPTAHFTNESIGKITGKPGQTADTTLGVTLLTSDQSTQQSQSRQIPSYNNYYSYGQQNYGAANSATADQILPPRADANSTILARVDESIKFPASDFMQPTGMNNPSLTATTASTSSTMLMPQSLGIDSQVGQQKWGGELAQKVVWLSSQQQQVAEIRLNPAHLGPIDVMLNINSDQATVQFVSSHLAVREAIEASLPRLREMMAENGITLGDASVGAESFQQQADTQQNNEESSSHGYDSHLAGANNESMDKGETSIPLNRHNGIVNTFA